MTQEAFKETVQHRHGKYRPNRKNSSDVQIWLQVWVINAVVMVWFIFQIQLVTTNYFFKYMCVKTLKIWSDDHITRAVLKKVDSQKVFKQISAKNIITVTKLKRYECMYI